MIKSYDNKRDESDTFYKNAINKAKPYLDKAFSGERDNNLAQNTEANTNIAGGGNTNIAGGGNTGNSITKDQISNTLPNGIIVKKGTGNCPNGCKLMQYDNRLCQNEIYNGKSYRSCPW